MRVLYKNCVKIVEGVYLELNNKSITVFLKEGQSTKVLKSILESDFPQHDIGMVARHISEKTFKSWIL